MKDIMEIRRSQLIVPFGVGAIVNMPNESLMLCGIDKWNEYAGEKIYDERLQKHLRVKYFNMPASREKYPKGLPFVRFPKWFHCPRCRSLKPLEEWKERWTSIKHRQFDSLICFSCGVKLNPSRFIIACEHGHIDDFPWISWVHRDGQCDRPDLTLESGRGIAGLGGIKITCKTCGKHSTMAGSFDESAFKRIKFNCTGNKPWQGTQDESCVGTPRTLQRGASNVYFPQLVSSICIPPYSDDICSRIQQTEEWKVISSQTGGISKATEEELIKCIIRKVGGNEKEMHGLIERMLNSPTGEVSRISDTEYRYDEYRAFLGSSKKGQEDSKNFSIEIINGDRYGIFGIQRVVLAHRLREIRALVGFSRINPMERDVFGGETEENDSKSYLMPITEKKNNDWLPAIEVRGEGFFLEFNAGLINKWSETEIIRKRVGLMNKGFAEICKVYGREPKVVTPSFVLLHTFAHVLMRQLSAECGYSTASLRERLYCESIKQDQEMAGLLIYTASGDSEGSMGGLVRQGREDKLPNIIAKAIMSASWCSSDPACIESSGQGLCSLNLAACYACVLLPETSCEMSNRFLDRATLIGLPENNKIGFFSELLK